MKVLRGFSEERSSNKWTRSDVEVSEEDLLCMLVEMDLPEIALESLSMHDKFMLLSAEAEICLLKQRVLAGLSKSEDISIQMSNFKGIKGKILERLKGSYVPF